MGSCSRTTPHTFSHPYKHSKSLSYAGDSQYFQKCTILWQQPSSAVKTWCLHQINAQDYFIISADVFILSDSVAVSRFEAVKYLVPLQLPARLAPTAEAPLTETITVTLNLGLLK